MSRGAPRDHAIVLNPPLILELEFYLFIYIVQNVQNVFSTGDAGQETCFHVYIHSLSILVLRTLLEGPTATTYMRPSDY